MMSKILSLVILGAVAVYPGDPPQLTYSPVAPLELRWPVGQRGGTFAMEATPSGTVFRQTGGTPHVACLPCEIHPDLLTVPEESPPLDPHLALVVSEHAGGSVATFTTVGSNPEGMFTVGMEANRVRFWGNMDQAFPATVVPAIGEWRSESGSAPTVSIRGQIAPGTLGVPSHVAKQTVNLPGGVRVTSYFIKLGN